MQYLIATAIFLNRQYLSKPQWKTPGLGSHVEVRPETGKQGNERNKRANLCAVVNYSVRVLAFVLDCKDLPMNIMYSKDLAAREALGIMRMPSE